MHSSVHSESSHPIYYISYHLECTGSVNGSFGHVIRAKYELIRSVEHLVQF